MRFVQDFYKLNHPEKYMGDPNKVFYRSSWEKHAFTFLDNNIKVKRWVSEGVAIPYLKPTPDGSYKKSNYYPDLYVEYEDRNGNIVREMIEIKPLKQTKQSVSKKKKVKIVENHIYLINQLKWEAAKKWCAARGIKFSVITENSLFPK
jgi:hypothetical protein